MNNYILQPSEFNKSCSKSYLHTKPLSIYPNNCNPEIQYTCPSKSKDWKEPRLDDREMIMKNNIHYGGIICDNRARTNINNYVSSRNMTSFINNPNQYYASIDIESSLLYSSSRC